MVDRENRLKKKKDFERLHKKGKTVVGDFLFLKIVKTDLNTNHFGWVVSLRVSKKAVTRNKIRRQLKEITKDNFQDIKKGIDVLIITKPNIINKTYQEIKKELEDLFKKSNIYKEK